MSAAITNRRAVTAQPFVIHSDDSTLSAWLLSLGSPSIYSDTANAMWAVQCNDHDPSGQAGTAFIISAAAARRAFAGRYP